MSIITAVRSQFPVAVVCPACRGPLNLLDRRMVCTECHAHYGFDGDFPDLVVGERFQDELPDSELAFEEASSMETTRRYWIPLFRKIWLNADRPPVILSVGCGVGTEIDELMDAGFNPGGVDCGNRARFWLRRRYPKRLLLANGMNLPFEDHAFDGVFSSCVFPHVGVHGDSFHVEKDYYQKRLQLAKEIDRVLKPGGRFFTASPNRTCPFDLFHRREGGSLRPRWNSPADPFLLSLEDYRAMFREAGFASVAPLPPRHYWRFNRSQHSWKGRALAIPVRALFWLNSESARPWVRASSFAPWLVVQATTPFM